MTQKAVLPNIQKILENVSGDLNSKEILQQMLMELISFIQVYKRAEISNKEVEEIQAILDANF